MTRSKLSNLSQRIKRKEKKGKEKKRKEKKKLL